jgi:hypothetical protein
VDKNGRPQSGGSPTLAGACPLSWRLVEVRAFWPVTLHDKAQPALNLRYSRRPDVGEESVNFIKQNIGLVAKSAGCTEHFAGG